MEAWRKVRAKAEAATSLGELALLELAEHAGTPRPTVLVALRERATGLLGEASEDDKADALQALADIPGSTVLAVIEGRPSEVTDDDGHGAHESGHDGQPSMPSTLSQPTPVADQELGVAQDVGVQIVQVNGQNPGRRIVGRLVRTRLAGRTVVTGMTGQRRK